ncbi:Dabb family protein [Segetibacter koreensis]|uniref:Dabb family protein n=1 Tax=Segetibacter koreensis TaxID=398037 RepID=UPI000382A6A3|nr:Dabb family protein [Segetibacter koreensis]
MKLLYRTILLSTLSIFCIINSVWAQRKSEAGNLLRHIVVVTFKPGTSDEQMQAIDNSFKNLAKLNMVRGFEWGIGSEERDTSHVKHIYMIAFANKKDEASYGASPQHQTHIKLAADYIESVSATDYFVNK